MAEKGKLVRDHIPEIIQESGGEPKTRVLSHEDYVQALLDKLVEEAEELRDDRSLEERADVQEVLQAIDTALQFNPNDIEQARAKKAEERGAFDDRIWLKG